MTDPVVVVILGTALLLAASGDGWGRGRGVLGPGRAVSDDARDGHAPAGGHGQERAASAGRLVAATSATDDAESADDPVDDVGVVLELLAVATGAASLPDALRVVGDAVDGPTGRGLVTAGAALVLGAAWDEAWAAAGAEAWAAAGAQGRTVEDVVDGDRRTSRPFGSAGHRDTQTQTLDLVADCLRPAWVQGAAPGAALRAARDRHDREADARAVEAAERLAVRLVVPLGLCLLPAFTLLGLVPAVIALGTGLL